MNVESVKSRATSLDVARLAGLSRSTVSQVLNGNDARFPQDTRDRVAAAAEQLGYRPSRAGRALVTGVSDVIVVAVPNVTFGRQLQDAVDRIAQATAARGMSVVVRYAGDNLDATLTAILDLRPAAVVDFGVFLNVEARRTIESGGTKVVPDLRIVERVADNPNYLIGRLQARHLLAVADRQLVVAGLEDDRRDVFGPDRIQGAMDEARDLGAPEPDIIGVPLDRAGATLALSSVVSKHPDAALGFSCYNDEVAIAVMAAARALGLPVPERVAVVGADFTALGQLIEPPLSSVAVDMPGLVAAMLGELDLLQDPEASGATAPPDLAALVSLHVGGSS